MRLQRKIQRNGPLIVTTIGCLAVTIFQLPTIRRNFDRFSVLTEKVQEQGMQQQQYEMTKDFLVSRAAIADGRYSNGCLFTSVIDKSNTLASLAEGVTVTDPNTGNSQPPNTVVCDYNGNTGVIAYKSGYSEPVITDIASTGNTAIVRQAMAAHGIRLLPGNSNFGAGAHTLKKGD